MQVDPRRRFYSTKPAKLEQINSETSEMSQSLEFASEVNSGQGLTQVQIRVKPQKPSSANRRKEANRVSATAINTGTNSQENIASQGQTISN